MFTFITIVSWYIKAFNLGGKYFQNYIYFKIIYVKFVFLYLYLLYRYIYIYSEKKYKNILCKFYFFI